MKTPNAHFLARAAGAVVLIVLGAAAGYRWAQHDAQKTAPAAPAPERKVLYWFDPMVPDQHFDQPGRSPFMDMALQPKYADEGGSEAAGIDVPAGVRQRLGLRTATVERAPFATALTVVGTIDFSEREVAIVQARTSGFVERVYAHAPGDAIARGAPLVDVVVPQWAGAQQEFIALRRSGDTRLIAAARDRMRFLGMSESVIRAVERSGKAQASTTISAPIGGVIRTLDVRTGVTLAAGAAIAEINAIDPVWLHAAVPEAQATNIAVGDTVTAQLAADSGASLQGKVIAILPQANSAARTLTVRAELPNADQRLRPGQLARVVLHTQSGHEALSVPSEAVIRTGTRSVVIVAHGDRFAPADVATGRENEGRTEIIGGLQPGARVVVSGQFLIDSEANLRGALERLNTNAEQAPAHRHDGSVDGGAQ